MCSADVALWTPDLAAASCDMNSRVRPSGLNFGQATLIIPDVSVFEASACIETTQQPLMIVPAGRVKGDWDSKVLISVINDVQNDNTAICAQAVRHRCAIIQEIA